MRPVKKKLFLILGVSIIGVVFFFLWSQYFAVPAGGEEKVLVIARSSTTIGLDPAQVTDGSSFEVTRNIYDTLVEYETRGTEIKPALAKSWQVSENGLVWTFFLRDDVLFHDGSKFDAEAVVFNFARWMDPENPYHQDRFLYWGYKFAGVVKEVKAIGKYQVQFSLTKPMAPFISNLAMPAFAIASPAAVKKYGSDIINNPVGTGPFVLESWKNNEIVLTSNNQYWQGRPRVDKVVFKSVPDSEERYRLLVDGEAHIIDGLDSRVLEQLQQDNSFRLALRPSMNVGYLAMHNEKTYFENQLVRKAVNHAIDKERIIQEAFDGFAKPAKTVVPPSLWGYNHQLSDYQYDPLKAKELLTEAGYPYGFRTKLWVPPVARPYLPKPLAVAELIKQDLAEIGIMVDLVSDDWANYVERLQQGEHQLALLGWLGDNGDPDNFLYVLLDKDNATVGTAANISFYKNDQVHDLLIEAQQENNQYRRSQYYYQAQEIIMADAPLVPLVHTTPPLGVSSRVRNFIPHPTGIDKLSQVDLVN